MFYPTKVKMNRLLLISIFFVFASAALWNIPQPWVVSLVLGTGIPHVLLGIKYSKKGMQLGWNSLVAKYAMLFLIPLSFIFGFSMDVIGLILFFGLHHALSETFGHRHTLNMKSSSALFLLIFSTYLFSCRSDIFNIEVPLFFAAIPLLCGYFLSRQLTKKGVNFNDVLVEFPWIVGAPICLALSIYKSIPWEAFILFHFVFWGALPLFRENLFGDNPDAKKIFWRDALIWNGSGLVIMSGFTLYSYSALDFRLFEFILFVFYSMTYWHISASFFISKANPLWLNNLLQRG